MNNIYDLVIVGGGAGGLFAGAIAGENNLKTLIIEKENKLGKKMLATGNGRCNIANTNYYEYCYNNSEYVKSVFEQFANKDKLQNYAKPVLDKLKEYGLSFYSDNQGRVYPVSNSSQCVVSVLCNTLARFNVEIMLESTVNKIVKNNNLFEVSVSNQSIKAKNVLLCCGGSAVELATQLGHTSTQLTRSLAGFITQENFKKISGVRVNKAIVNAQFQNNLKSSYSPLVTIKDNTYSEVGEVIFKDNGVNGICVMNVSSVAARQNQTPKLWLDLLPDLSQEKVFNKLKESENGCGIKNVLYGWFAKPLAEYLINKYKTAENISQVIKRFEVAIKDTYENNQITCGGINVEELNLTQSKIINSLYLSGEMLNIDAICGGYNLMFALASAGVTVKHILSNN